MALRDWYVNSYLQDFCPGSWKWILSVLLLNSCEMSLHEFAYVQVWLLLLSSMYVLYRNV